MTVEKGQHGRTWRAPADCSYPSGTGMQESDTMLPKLAGLLNLHRLYFKEAGSA